MMTSRFIITAVATLMCVSTYALTTPLDAVEPMPALIAAAESACATSNVVNPTIVPIVAANADFIAAFAREAGLAELPCFDRETPAAVMYAYLIKRLARRGISEGLRRDFVAFFELFKEREI